MLSLIEDSFSSIKTAWNSSVTAQESSKHDASSFDVFQGVLRENDREGEWTGRGWRGGRRGAEG